MPVASRAVVIGAGIGGLTAAVLLRAHGFDVDLLERHDRVGGKMDGVLCAGRWIDTGPTVLTMRRVFDEIFAACGARLDDHVGLRAADILARHHWTVGATLDLHADRARSAEAIGRFAGAAEAANFRRFSERAEAIWNTLEPSFIRADRPSMPALVRRAGWRAASRISPFTTLAQSLRASFGDARLRQLFGRYATYCGSSPFEAPATLMLVAHLESQGVWLVEGGMRRLADAFAALASRMGVRLHLNRGARNIVVRRGRACGVELEDGGAIGADAVISNADVAALEAGLFGEAARHAVARDATLPRSLSAITWAFAAHTHGLPLERHNVFFAPDEAAEFAALAGGALPAAPTLYVCAADRPGDPAGPEGLLCLVNAPARGPDAPPPREEDLQRCKDQVMTRLSRAGLVLTPVDPPAIRTGPAEFARRFPATGGALYGMASHGWTASFRRPGARSRLPGLYLAGGSTHPGPGVPMAAISGMLAASALMADLSSTRRSVPMAISGGTSMRLARTQATV